MKIKAIHFDIEKKLSHLNHLDFSLFLDVLIATIQKNDPQWTESEAEEWKTIREKALTLLETR